MDITHLNIGFIHSLIGKNDGVSIVIDQTVQCMIEDLNIDLGNIHFLAAHTTPRFNAQTNDVFWHKNKQHKWILKNFSSEPPAYLDNMIHRNALYAKQVIEEFVKKNEIDLIIAHNTSHPYNFITAVGLGYYFEELRKKGLIWPKILVWWHDSYFERKEFENPNPVIKKYLKYLPGYYIDGLVFINKQQPEFAKRFFKEYNSTKLNLFFRERTAVIPNTSDINWDWKNREWHWDEMVYPEKAHYNNTFFKDIGLTREIKKLGYSLYQTAILLQHTRIVNRKNIELAIDFSFRLEKLLHKNGHNKKCVALLISGHGGDEMEAYKKFLKDYFQQKTEENPDAKVIMIFGEKRILSHRDIIIDNKYYDFKEIPSIVAAHGGIGTYFSEVEGYGNNLLEMISYGLPVIVNKYDIYKSEIEPLGFKLPTVENAKLTDKVLEQGYKLLTDYNFRNQMVRHNLEVLDKKLPHKIIAKKLIPLVTKIFTKKL